MEEERVGHHQEEEGAGAGVAGMGRPPEDPVKEAPSALSLREVSARLCPAGARPEWTSGCAISFLLDLGGEADVAGLGLGNLGT